MLLPWFDDLEISHLETRSNGDKSAAVRSKVLAG